MSLAVVRTPIIPVVTALPAGYNGQEVLYKAGSGDTSVYWHLRYDSSITDSYKWRAVGAQDPLFDEVATSETTTSTSYTNLATTGPQLTAPLAGVYNIKFGYGYAQGSSGTVALGSIALGGTAASDNLTARAGDNQHSPSRECTATLAASDVVIAKYRASAGTSSWSQRYLRLSPRRVG